MTRTNEQLAKRVQFADRVCSKEIAITAVLPDDVAWSLAQFLKRVAWDDVAKNAPAGAGHREEVERMIDGLNTIAKALADAGYAPR